MEKLFIQGKGDDQVQLTVNVTKEMDAMMNSIKEEGMEVWTDRDIDLYKEAKRRLGNLVDIEKPKEILVVKDVQQEKKKQKKSGYEILAIILIISAVIAIVGVGWVFMKIGLSGIAIVIYVVSLAFGCLFGKG